MSSLQFLNKKSWHVGTRKNEEKVWLLEQAAKKEAERVAELQKQLEEERKLEAVRRLELESGNSAAVPRAPCVEWMYEGPGAALSAGDGVVAASTSGIVENVEQRAAAQEEMLLGNKEATLDDSAGNVTGHASADAAAPDEVSLRDAESKLREDPLLAILKRADVRQTGRSLSDRPQMARNGLLSQYTVQGLSSGHDKSQSPGKCSPSVDDSRLRKLKDEKRARKEERAKVREERRSRRETREKELISRKRTLVSEAENLSSLPKRRSSRFDSRPNLDGERESAVVSERKDVGTQQHIESQHVPGNPSGYDEMDMRRAYATRRGANCETIPVDKRRREADYLPPRESRKVLVRNELVREKLPLNTLSAKERAAKVAEMQRNADSLEKERKDRIRLHHEMEVAERTEQWRRSDQSSQEPQPEFLLSFARRAIDHADQAGIAQRARSRQASSLLDENMRY